LLHTLRRSGRTAADRPVMLSNRMLTRWQGAFTVLGLMASARATLPATHDPLTASGRIERPTNSSRGEQLAFAAAASGHRGLPRERTLRLSLGPDVDRCSCAKASLLLIRCRPVLVNAFLMALEDAFANREPMLRVTSAPIPRPPASLSGGKVPLRERSRERWWCRAAASQWPQCFTSQPSRPC